MLSKDLEKNTITVADRDSNSEILNSIKEIIVPNLTWASDVQVGGVDLKEFPFKTSVRIRYRQEKQGSTLEKKSDGYHIIFDVPQEAIAVGQSAVLYDGETCLGGGIIEKVV